jgi:peptidase M15-like protein
VAHICPPLANVGLASGQDKSEETQSGAQATGSPLAMTSITNADQGAVFSWSLADLSIGYSCADSITNYPFGDHILLVPTSTCVTPSNLPAGNHLTITAGGSVASDTICDPGDPWPIEPVLQSQNGSFYGTGVNGIINFDQSGNIKWSVPNDSPQIATADGGVIGASGITYDSNGNATGQLGTLPIQSWTGNAYTDGPVTRVAVPPVAVATPPFWSIAGANQSTNETSPLCRNEIDALVAEYGTNTVKDVTYIMELTDVTSPRFTPNCFDFINSNSASLHSQYFSSDELSQGYTWLLVKYPLVASTSAGYGLDKWRELYGSSRTINSSYRDPDHNTAIKGASSSRHMFGDAIDLKNVSRTVSEFVLMNTAAKLAGADFVESLTEYCGLSLGCAHADWRYHDHGKYVH